MNERLKECEQGNNKQRSNAMKRYITTINQALTVMLVLMPGLALGFDSGSTGADGALNPTVNTQLQLPPSGIFNFTSVNIPSGVTVTFQKNTTNTPVTILASSNVTIVGALGSVMALALLLASELLPTALIAWTSNW